MTVLSEQKKRRVKLGAILGAASGVLLAVALYLASDPNPVYLVFIPIAAALGAGQMYMIPESQ
ncbi:MAG: hypothetical protein LBE47_03795 [Methanomassiliicoccaceae archaeon]|nr:hypothetical protein [Methanomassiliicoccaceae archaeon]